MRTKFFVSFWLTATLTTVLITSGLAHSQSYYSNEKIPQVPQYPGYAVNPYSSGLYSPESAYIANRETAPQSVYASAPASAVAPPQTNPLKPSVTATPAISTEPVSRKNIEKADSSKAGAVKTTSLSEKKSKSSVFSSIFTPSNKDSKTTTDSPKSKSKELAKDADDGLATIEAIAKEQSYSEPDYVNSATRSSGTTAKDHYKQGLQSEAQGDFPGAIQHYNAFIAANKKQMTTGTLAAPYHRLALIAWKLGEIRNSEVYFRYALNYALSGNVPIIAGDYALFLMERNDLTQAEVILRNALTNYPDNNRLLYYLGRCTARQGKPMESLRLLTASVGEEQAYQELALFYRQQGEFDRAVAMDTKRNEYLAHRKTTVPQQVFAQYQYPNSGNRVQYPNAVPIAPPPVMTNPRGMLSQATWEPGIPFPTPNNPEGRQEQVYMYTPNPAKPPVPTVQPSDKTAKPQPPPSATQPQEIPVAQWQAKPTRPQENVAVQWQTTTVTKPQDNTPTVPNTNWQPMPAPPAPPSMVSPVPTIGTAPISKVFYYPSNETTPVYKEF